ncbi:MAG: DUF2461 domain-containing protein [Bacteroidetes bacterium]|nr:DUF2461 domain-containing protein [Bacteroidota bacterium]
MKPHTIQPATLKFLKDLAKHNERPWFEAHRGQYEAAHGNMIAFAEQVLAEMAKHDEIEKKSGKASLHRIYRDVRFSKDKTPYSPRLSIGMQRATKLRRGGYYVHIQPGASFIGCGFFGPEPKDLLRIRQDIDLNYDAWRKLLKAKGLRDIYGEMQGDQLVNTPKGYERDHPAADLLRYKQFLFRHDYTDAEVLADDFAKKVSGHFRVLRPWLDHMSEILTTDVNGELIV